MKTLVFGLKISYEHKSVIQQLQKEYSIAFRQVYNNLELSADPNFLNSLNIKSKRQLEYLIKEVNAKYKINEANKERIRNNIKKLEEKGTLKAKENKRLIHLKRSLKSNIVFGNRKEYIKLSKGNGDINIWRESRLLPLVFYGEANRKGSRFFNFKGLSKGEILFKLEATDIKIPLIFNPKKYKELELLEYLALNKEIPVTVKLSKDKLYITYDEEKLNDNDLDIKSFYKEISHIKDKENRRVLIANRYIEHEESLKKGKLDRYIGLDLNPDGIGYSIINGDDNIVYKGYFDLSKVNKKNITANKRKYEISHVIKRLFTYIEHYKVHSIVIEDLDIEPKDNGNKVSNRKINNVWNRLFIKQLIERRCKEKGLILRYINPVYSSFIGNLLHNEYDPIAASLEVVRRGKYKRSKGSFYPELDITYFINDKMYDEIKGCTTWKDMWLLFTTAKRSYRRKLKEFSFTGYNISSKKSKVKHLTFQ